MLWLEWLTLVCDSNMIWQNSEKIYKTSAISNSRDQRRIVMRDEVLFARVLVSLITILCFVSVLLYYEGGNKETREYLKKRLNSNLVHYLLYLELLIMYIFGGVSLAIFTYTDWLENYCNMIRHSVLHYGFLSHC